MKLGQRGPRTTPTTHVRVSRDFAAELSRLSKSLGMTGRASLDRYALPALRRAAAKAATEGK